MVRGQLPAWVSDDLPRRPDDYDVLHAREVQSSVRDFEPELTTIKPSL
jgi:hypothetical protein